MSKIVTIFKNIKDSQNPFYIEVEKIVDRIKNPKPELKELIQKIQSTENKKERDKLKEELPSICFSGEFSARNNHSIKKSSGLICLDFDHVGVGEELENVKSKITQDPYVHICFISPSGDGLKVIIKIPESIELYGKYYDALRLYFKQFSDSWDELRDIARVCYQSYDENVYYNTSSKTFDILVREKDIVLDHSFQGEKLTDQEEIFRRLKTWADSKNEYSDGNKHKFLVFLASACNRFGLEEEFVASKMVEGYQTKASFVEEKDFYDIVKRVYVSYTNQHGISFFDLKGAERFDYDPISKARDVIYLDDIKAELLDSYFNKESTGETTYYRDVDPCWTWRKGELTLMHGIPNHGKSTMILTLMLLKSIKEGVKWGIFSPEQNPPIDFYMDLAHAFIGKPAQSHIVGCMTKDELLYAIDQIKQWFFFIYPKDDAPTPSYINERFKELMIKEGATGFLIDPYNQLERDQIKFSKDREDLYISSFLSTQKRFALDNNVYMAIIAHPKGGMTKMNEKSEDKELKNSGNYPCPDVYDLAGGAMWNNKCDNILVTYQPYYNTRMGLAKNMTVETRATKDLKTVSIISQKIKKQKIVGTPGTSYLVYDVFSSRYYEEQYIERDEYGFIDRERSACPFDDWYENRVKSKNGSSNGDVEKVEEKEVDWSQFKTSYIAEENKKMEEEEQEKNIDMFNELGIQGVE
jgi:hypothetical protein